MLAAGNSPYITKRPTSERYLLHLEIKRIEPEREVGRPFFFLWFGQVGSLIILA